MKEQIIKKNGYEIKVKKDEHLIRKVALSKQIDQFLNAQLKFVEAANELDNAMNKINPPS